MQNTVFKRTLPVFLALLMLAVVGLGAYFLLNQSVAMYPRTTKEKDLVTDALYYIETNLKRLDLIMDASYKALEETKRYIISGSVSNAALSSQLDTSAQLITNQAAELTQPSNRLMEWLAVSPFESAEFAAMYDILIILADSCLDDIEQFRWLTGPECPFSDSEKLKILDCYQIIWDEDARTCGYASNEILLPITNRSALNDFLYEYLPTLTHIPLNAASWLEDKETLQSAQDECWNKQQAAEKDRNAMLGDYTMAVAIMRESLIQQYMQQGMSRADAEKYVQEQLAQDGGDLSEDDLKKLRLREAIIQRYVDQGASRPLAAAAADELLPKYLELRDKYTPQEGDDAGILWAKLEGLMRWQLYDWAEPCVDALEALGGNGDFYAEEYLPALRTFVRSVDFGQIDYGAMVAAWEGPDSVNEVFRIGDIIIEFNGEPCRSAVEYYAAKEDLSGPDYTVGVLRLNRDGELERIDLELTTDMPKVGLRSLNRSLDKEDDDGLQS